MSRKKKQKKRSEQDATLLHQSIFGEENGELVSRQPALNSKDSKFSPNLQGNGEDNLQHVNGMEFVGESGSTSNPLNDEPEFTSVLFAIIFAMDVDNRVVKIIVHYIFQFVKGMFQFELQFLRIQGD